MEDLFFMGGPIFMSILTILLIILCAWIIYHLFVFFKIKQLNKDKCLRLIKYGKSIGLFALIIGIFAQLIGFYQAFSAIEKASDISPAMVYAGIKTSMVSTLYGILIYLFSIMLWFVASIIIERKS
ncbi:MotA/TolQ/ExbB proton channel family protein [Flavivirga eckloniae]|uniref:MotA/TolQ/ExbB proton channel domain-containing protein n=1 Tax=Flavivirga eckloniae TaxID=1803846 RepID=A0A2K9PTJ9_9FLAO|nr:MotA/TolQ/ExbB proton channel family protein [Flavivirga eckloniae]AUP80385.1 hypothetical protein C1H87_17380 [Flavivirga eckloniae]